MVASSDLGERLTLRGAVDREHDQLGAGERRVREGETGERVLVVARRHDEALALVELGRTGEQRRGVPVGPEPEMDQPDRRARPARSASYASAAASRLAPAWRIEWMARGSTSSRNASRAIPSFEFGSWTSTQRSSPQNTSIADQSTGAVASSS